MARMKNIKTEKIDISKLRGVTFKNNQLIANIKGRYCIEDFIIEDANLPIINFNKKQVYEDWKLQGGNTDFCSEDGMRVGSIATVDKIYFKEELPTVNFLGITFIVKNNVDDFKISHFGAKLFDEWFTVAKLEKDAE